MKATADTNILLRAFLRDDAAQARTASRILREADIIAVPLSCLCELVWVLRRVYRLRREEIADLLEALLNTHNVAVNRAAASAALSVYRAGGDFADGVIAWEGEWLGGETFVSFDKKAVAAMRKQGISARLVH
ncbi:MAG TPA: type II toxin-antitoxin system VapC family toxin [Acidobacteriaceae bacterium]|nr:type II toxin-antitoxin system VapC family toxin [Acidobacteriaceae bacterium]